MYNKVMAKSQKRENFLTELLAGKRTTDIDNYEELEDEFMSRYGAGFELLVKNKVVHKSLKKCYFVYDVAGSCKKTTIKEHVLETLHKKNVWYFQVDEAFYYADSKIKVEKSIIRDHWGFCGEFESLEDYSVYERMIEKIQSELSDEKEKFIGSHKITAIDMFMNYCLNDSVKHPGVTLDEFKVFEGMNNGGLIYSCNENIKGMQSFDINSAYLYILSRCGVFPICEPTIMSTEEVKKDVDIKKTYGLYMLDVDKKTLDKRFCAYSENQYYTQIDIIAMMENKVKFELCKDGKHYIYEHVKDFSSKFEKIINPLYELKQKDKYKKHAKSMMLKFWGGLCQRKTKSIKLEEYDSEIYPFVKEMRMNSVTVYTGEFEYYFARMKPFLLAMARYRTGQTIRKVLDAGHKIVRIYTDSFISDISTKEFKKLAKLNDDLGSYKIEKFFENDDKYIHANMLESKRNEINEKKEQRIKEIKEEKRKTATPKQSKKMTIDDLSKLFKGCETEVIEF